MSHANARLTFHGRCLLVRRVRFDGRPVSHVAKEMGISRQCAHRWVARFDLEGWVGLRDRSTRAHSYPSRTPADVEHRVLRARVRLRAGRDRIAEVTGVPPRTVSRILARHAMPAIVSLDPVTGIVIRASKQTGRRYERAIPGDLVHVDVKKLGRIPDGGGWRVHGPGTSRERQRKHQRIGFDYVHAVVDDHSRMAYAEIHPDEKGSTAAGVLLRAAQAFASHGVTIREVISDNAFAYRHSTDFKDAVAALGARQLFIKPHCPWQNGKVERFNRTLQTEWAYRRPYSTNDQRTQALDPWLDYYNNQRTHHGIGGKPPITRFPSPKP
jgi:transposase InsO family protein